ncbi:MAG: GNAT family N-acetyltransferase [Bacteroidetes bacterium]|nr:GNAT family N-acetyltransferase [Bacteroidota bacterium]
MVQIRLAEAGEAELVAEISRETFYDTFAVHNTVADMDKFMAEQFSKEQLVEEFSQAGHCFFLAWVDDIPAGYIFLKNKSHQALGPVSAMEISRLYVRKPFIGKGIGKSLMQKAIAFAEQEQKEWIWLGVWEHNQPAIDFYTAFGYEKFSEHEFILGDDVQLDWLMKRSLIQA